ncbi:MAG TPA: DUF5668 domain-containing protein [Bryobacteraceae bacterium]|nr:DUF5668 domain-containing protein [Bryobacteraceae bacterium]
MDGNNSYQIIRAIRGPITLITLGVLFALQNFTNLGFDKTWPVLLIVFGLLSLMQRGAAPPRPAQMPPMPPPPQRGYTSSGYAGSPYAQPPASSTPPPPGSSPGGTV